ncbi:DUF5776 domain-containing protein [Levilactobacillus sp. HBUAS67566]|uniref:DUF5776 domain-containing protein n=2 Tax=Lactobacillales TaxID=186826 RepID=UPI002FF2A9E7
MMKILYGGLVLLGLMLGIGLPGHHGRSRHQHHAEMVHGGARVTAQAQRTRSVFTASKTAQPDRKISPYNGIRTSVTANDNYVVKRYWAGDYRQLYVTAAHGINSYRTSRLTGLADHINRGDAVAVVGVTHRGEVTRYQLANGTYITGNKQFVAPTQHQTIKQVRSKTSIRRYEDVNLTKVVKGYQQGTRMTVTGWQRVGSL